MKKIFALATFVLCMAFTTASHAQLQRFTRSADTAADATTVNLTVTPPAYYVAAATVQLNVIKVSGTVAGTARLTGSLDGVNYATVPGTDTLTLTNASQSKVWSIGSYPYQYLRIIYTTTGTQRSVPAALILSRKS